MVKRKQVTWKDGHKPSPVLRPIPYSHDVPVTEEYSKVLAEKLVPGNMFFTVKPLNKVVHGKEYAEPPYPYLALSKKTSQMYPQGSTAIYAGTVRVEEQKGNSILRAVRHSFIIAGARYIRVQSRGRSW
jgi:hypothetical protein